MVYYVWSFLLGHFCSGDVQRNVWIVKQLQSWKMLQLCVVRLGQRCAVPFQSFLWPCVLLSGDLRGWQSRALEARGSSNQTTWHMERGSNALAIQKSLTLLNRVCFCTLLRSSYMYSTSASRHREIIRYYGLHSAWHAHRVSSRASRFWTAMPMLGVWAEKHPTACWASHPF